MTLNGVTKNVGIGEFIVSSNPGEVIGTQGLGSCIAVVAMGKTVPVAGLLHIQLPTSATNLDLAARRPGVFADTAIPLFIEQFTTRGLKSSDLVVKVVGGAKVVDSIVGFDIGKRNYLAAKKHLWSLRLWPAAEAVGGTISRTVKVEVGKKDVIILTPGLEKVII